jgi:DHA1 family multidrug resistance protein-like MFS transporter/DHA1 family quinolone resistance protein-like MFS transporter
LEFSTSYPLSLSLFNVFNIFSNMRLLLISTFVISLSVGILAIVIPLYAAIDLGASYTEIGLLGVAYVVFNAALSVPVGRIGDRKGRKPFIVGGFLATAYILLLYPMSGSIVSLLVLRLAQGAAETPVWVNTQSAVADLSSAENRGAAMGAYATSWTSGIGIGPIVGGLLYSSVGARWAFLTSGFIALAATAIVITVPFAEPKPIKRKISLKPILPTFLPTVIYVGFVAILFTVLPVYATRSLGMSEFLVGTLIAVYTLVRAPLFSPFGKISDRVGHRPIIIVGTIVGSAALAGMSLAAGYLAIAAFVVLFSASEALIYPAVVCMISKAGEGNLGFSMGIFNAVAMLGWGAFSGMGGPLADAFGPASVFLIFSLVGFISLPIMWKLLPKK